MMIYKLTNMEYVIFYAVIFLNRHRPSLVNLVQLQIQYGPDGALENIYVF